LSVWTVADVFPRRLAKEDAEKLTVPFICLFSKEDGTPELMREYQDALEMKKKENVVETCVMGGWVLGQISTTRMWSMN